MQGKLVLRFDDICPTMNWPVWQGVEEALREAGIRPLVAVIPDNRDPSFHLTAPRHDFWDQVRDWRSLGWTIAVHGYQHSYVTGCSGLLGINRASEFAGLSAGEQERKIRLALEIFGSEGLESNVWVAPGHSFDATTLRILPEFGLDTVSDGFSCFPYRDAAGILWVPQQMWRFRPVPFGIWTVCLHHNFWGPGAVVRFRNQLRKHRSQIVSFEEIIRGYETRRHSAIDAVSGMALRTMLRLKQTSRRLIGGARSAASLQAE